MENNKNKLVKIIKNLQMEMKVNNVNITKEILFYKQ